MYHKLSRSTGQKSRSQRDITYQHQNAVFDADTEKGNGKRLALLWRPHVAMHLQLPRFLVDKNGPSYRFENAGVLKLKRMQDTMMCLDALKHYL